MEKQDKEIDKQISYERNVGIIPDPNAQLLQQQQQQGQNGQAPEMQGDYQQMSGDMSLSGDPTSQIAMGGGGAPGAPAGAPGTAPM